jgi:hypothetical protein
MLESRIDVALEALDDEPVWLPDVFALIFDALAEPDCPALDLRTALLQPQALADTDLCIRRYLPELKKAQAVSLGSLTSEFKEFLRDGLHKLLDMDFRDAGATDTLRALWVMESLLRSVGSWDENEPYAAHYRKKMVRGRTLIQDTEKVGGWLLPRCVGENGPAHGWSRRAHAIDDLDDYFGYLVRIRYPQLGIDYSRVDRLLFDMPRSDSLRVGVIPIVHDGEELNWSAPTSDSYRVRIRHNRRDELKGRMLEALNWLAERKVDLVLMPELVGSVGMLDAVQDWRRKHLSLWPRLILAGSFLLDPKNASENPEEPDSPRERNRAYVIKSDGDELCLQDKMHRQSVSPDDQYKGMFRDQAHRSEHICITPRRLAVRDLGPGYRLCVLSWADFSSPELQRKIAKLAVSTILVPAMNRPCTASEYSVSTSEKGRLNARMAGALCCIANSAALAQSHDIFQPIDFSDIVSAEEAFAGAECQEVMPAPPGSAFPQAVIMRASPRFR